MRIGLIHSNFRLGGGLENYLRGFYDSLRRAGHEVHVITARADEWAREEFGGRLHFASDSPRLFGAGLLRFCRESARVSRALALDATLGFSRTIRQDVHRASGGCHLLYSRLLPPWKRWGLKNQVELRLERELYTSGRTPHFVVNSAQVGRQLREAYSVPIERLSVLYTPVDTERFAPLTEPSEKRELRRGINPGSSGSGDVFLFVSRHHRRKGLDVLLRIWRRVEAELWIVGVPLSSAHQAEIRKHGLETRIHYLGQRAGLPAIHRACDFFIHPTLYDACANTVLQAMASGLPVIVSSMDGATDLIRHGENGLRLEEPRDAGEVFALIGRAQSLSPVERRAMGEAARATVLPLTWEAHVREWEHVIQRAHGAP